MSCTGSLLALRAQALDGALAPLGEAVVVRQLAEQLRRPRAFLPSAKFTSASVNSVSGITSVRGYSFSTNSSRWRAALGLPWLK